jgi:ATP-grasp ribosomal peptide maturase
MDDGLLAVTVLVLSEELDPTVDRVVAAMTERGVPVFRCDTGWFPRHLTLSSTLEGDRWAGVLRTAHRRVELEQVHAVWYRRPTAFTLPELPPAQREHAIGEARYGLGGVLASLPAYWMNHPGHEADAVYKPRQLAAAVRCGLAVPRTLITNDPAAVRAFTGSLPGPIVTKMLGSNIRIDPDRWLVAHTRLLTDTDLADLAGVEATAHLFQEWVDKAYEARVVVVDGELFTVGIHAGSEASRVDWRADYDALRYSVQAPPPPVAAGLHRFMALFGLSYAAFDFAIDTDGRWVFLECNPGGQYGWLEGHTGLPITAAIAGALARGGRP